jgi:hypothetical protein
MEPSWTRRNSALRLSIGINLRMGELTRVKYFESPTNKLPFGRHSSRAAPLCSASRSAVIHGPLMPPSLRSQRTSSRMLLFPVGLSTKRWLIFWIIYCIFTVFKIVYTLDRSSVNVSGETPLRKDVTDARSCANKDRIDRHSSDAFL